MFKNKEPLYLLIISFVLLTLMFDLVVILYGEIRTLGGQRVQSHRNPAKREADCYSFSKPVMYCMVFFVLYA